MIIEGSIVRLRPLRDDETAHFAAIADDISVARMLGSSFPSPYTTDDARWWISHMRKGHDSGRPVNFAIAHAQTDIAMGCIGLDGESALQDGVALGYWLGSAYRGNGYVSAAGRLILAYAFGAYGLDMLPVAAGADNPESMAVIHRLGFYFVRDYQVDPASNKRGQRDFKWFELTRTKWQALQPG